MSVVVHFEIDCDVCRKRYQWSQEAVANTMGVTKASGAAECRKEAQQQGWSRRKLGRVWIDLCPGCVDRKPGKVWFQRWDKRKS